VEVRVQGQKLGFHRSIAVDPYDGKSGEHLGSNRQKQQGNQFLYFDPMTGLCFSTPYALGYWKGALPSGFQHQEYQLEARHFGYRL
jgi:uncharacterized iron-regulated membrane protein